MTAVVGMLTVVLAGFLPHVLDSTPEPQVKYAALGDSFSAGTGSGGYDETSGNCLRSPRAYGPLWAGAHHAGAFQFLACSGALVQDVLDEQVPQLSPDATMVTLSAGGNDAAFVPVVARCTFGTDEDCQAISYELQNRMRQEFPALLRPLYRAVRERAPHARLIVVGYPLLFDTQSECPASLSLAKRSALDQATEMLDTVTRDAAVMEGADFLDPRQKWGDHAVCSAQPWVNPMVLPASDSYHPNAIGQRVYLEQLEGVLNPARRADSFPVEES
ncbi:SGNH/GDSL hydrolase family protein [Kitasatospora sp. NPDC056076]|uniref:SGNH/GDSL hydrolase family protein n=1 Tax=Kitasatospora sp. NPDC056076 TaxID=3345703 RepID=UPI0035D9D5FA